MKEPKTETEGYVVANIRTGVVCAATFSKDRAAVEHKAKKLKQTSSLVAQYKIYKGKIVLIKD